MPLSDCCCHGPFCISELIVLARTTYQLACDRAQLYFASKVFSAVDEEVWQYPGQNRLITASAPARLKAASLLSKMVRSRSSQPLAKAAAIASHIHQIPDTPRMARQIRLLRVLRHIKIGHARFDDNQICAFLPDQAPISCMASSLLAGSI